MSALQRSRDVVLWRRRPPPSPLSIFGSKIKLDLDADFGIGFGTGAKVASWADRSSYGNNVSQGTSGSQPTWAANVLNGHAAVQQNGSQWLSNLAAAGIVSGATIRMYSIASFTASGSFAGALLCLGVSGSADSSCGLKHFSGSMYFQYHSGGVSGAEFYSLSTAGQSSVPALFDGRIDTATATLAMSGADVKSQAATAGGLSSTISRIYIGVLEDTTSQRLTGQTLRHLVIQPAPTAGEHAALITYFKRTYPSLALP